MRMITEKRDRRFTVFQLDFLQSFLDDLFDYQFVHFLHGWCSGVWSSVARSFLSTSSLDWFSMLRGYNHGVDFLGLYRTIRLLQVLNGDLCLSIWAQPPKVAALAHICQFLS